MALRTLHSEAAGLLRGAADTTMQGRELEERAKTRNADMVKTGINTIAGLAERKMSEQGATERQQIQSDAQLIDITEALANGAEQATGDPAWKQMVGKKLRADVYSAMLVHGQKQDLPISWEFEDAVDGDKTQTYILNKRTGERFPIGKAGKGGKGNKGSGSGASLSGEDKEFIKTYRQYAKDTENFNYEMLKGLSTHDPKQAQDLEMKLNFVDKNKKRFNDLQGIDTPASPAPAPSAAPSSGSASPAGGAADDTAAAIKYLKDKFPGHRKAWTTEDINWARKKLNG